MSAIRGPQCKFRNNFRELRYRGGIFAKFAVGKRALAQEIENLGRIGNIRSLVMRQTLNSLNSLISLKNNKGDCHEPFGSRNDDT